MKNEEEKGKGKRDDGGPWTEDACPSERSSSGRARPQRSEGGKVESWKLGVGSREAVVCSIQWQ